MVIEFPESVYAIVKNCVGKHPRPEDAVKEAERRIRALPAFNELLNNLIKTAISELVYRERSQQNKILRNQAGEYGGPAKVVVGSSDLVNQVYQSYYNYYIGANRLGMLMGEQLLTIAQQERGLSDGHLFNARLLETLRPLVPDDKQVQAAVSERKLRGIFEKLKAEGRGGAA